MLSRQHRFRGQRGLAYVYRKGKTVRSPFCAMKFVPGRHETYRVAIVVSKKVDKSSPVRNRIRRRIYEVIRLNADNYLTNQDIVITVFDDKFLFMPYEQMAESIRRQLEQISKLS